MKEHFNKLSPAEAERLALLVEELGEAQQAVGKILRHGYESFNPCAPDHKGNRQDLMKELADVRAVIQMMILRGDVSEPILKLLENDKLETVSHWLHH